MRVRSAATAAISAAALLSAGSAAAAAPTGRPAPSATVASSVANAINNRAEIVGTATTPSGVRHAMLWRTDGVVDDLGTLGGATSAAYGINDLGEIVGVSETASGARHAFRWAEGTMTDLGALPGTTDCAALDVNDRGQAVGVCRESSTPHPVLWSGGRVIDLDVQPEIGQAYGINDRGEIIGSRLGYGLLTLYRPGQDPTVVGSSNVSSEFHIAEINDRGEIVGNGHDGDHATLWRPDLVSGEYRSTDLGTLGGGHSFAYDLNERGEAVGESNTDSASHAFVWAKGAMTDLGTLGGTNSVAFGVNDRGEAVGWSNTADGEFHATLWSDGEVIDLGLVPDPPR